MISIAVGFWVIFLSIVLAVAGLVLVQRRVPLAIREPHNNADSIIVRRFMSWLV